MLKLNDEQKELLENAVTGLETANKEYEDAVSSHKKLKAIALKTPRKAVSESLLIKDIYSAKRKIFSKIKPAGTVSSTTTVLGSRSSDPHQKLFQIMHEYNKNMKSIEELRGKRRSHIDKFLTFLQDSL